MNHPFSCEVVHIHHDCFFLLLETEQGVRTLLFDYPSPGHLPEPAARAAEPYFSCADLTVFVSHSHGDHFGPQVVELAARAQRVEWVVSYDVPEMYQQFEKMENVYVAEPEEELWVRDMRVLPVESTDLGVGFLIEWSGKRIFFAGDVAEWDWEEGDDASRAFAREFYGKSLAPLRQAPIDLAFHNADQRLANWAGGVRFAREIAPRILIPMHAFGDLASLRRFALEARDAGVDKAMEILLFDAPGDVKKILL